MADVVIVGNANGGAITKDVAVLYSEFNPTGGVLGMAIVLVAAEVE